MQFSCRDHGLCEHKKLGNNWVVGTGSSRGPVYPQHNACTVDILEVFVVSVLHQLCTYVYMYCSFLTKILYSRAVAVGLPVIQRVMRCLLSCLWVSSLLSALAVKRAVCRWRGSAPSHRASSCILVAVSWSPSSMIDFIMRPAALTMASEGCWKSLNNVRPRLATSSRTMSNFSASVVSLKVGEV